MMRPQAEHKGEIFLIKRSGDDEDFDTLAEYIGPAGGDRFTFALRNGRLTVDESCIFGLRPTVGGLALPPRAAAAPVADLEAKVDAPESEPAGRGVARNAGRGIAGMILAEAALASSWRTKTGTGTRDNGLVFVSAGGHTCAARIRLAGEGGGGGGGGEPEPIAGTFHSDRLHAEMDALQTLVRGGRTLAAIAVIEIEKQPCPRCAVALDVLGLAAKVRYKTPGQKDYPTWRFPDLGEACDWTALLGISGRARNRRDQEALKEYFQTQKWW
ncbi:MAG: hypothetical protein ACJ76N_02880 [Thermoanaerobaculia bacterium]